MTEKRYDCKWTSYDISGQIWDNKNPYDYMNVQEVCDRLNELTEENAQLKELINMICESDSYTKRSSVKEILRDTIKSIDTAAEYSCDAWNDYCKLSKFFEKQYNEETWDNYD